MMLPSDADHFPPIPSLQARVDARPLFARPKTNVMQLAMNDLERVEARTALERRHAKPTDAPKRNAWTDPVTRQDISSLELARTCWAASA